MLGSSFLKTVGCLRWSQSSLSVFISPRLYGLDFFSFFLFGRGMWIGAVAVFGLQNGEQIEGTLSPVIASSPRPFPLLCRGLPVENQWCVCNTFCELSSETSLEARYEGGQLSKGVCDSPRNCTGPSLMVCVSLVHGRAWSWGSALPFTLVLGQCCQRGWSGLLKPDRQTEYIKSFTPNLGAGSSLPLPLLLITPSLS